MTKCRTFLLVIGNVSIIVLCEEKIILYTMLILEATPPQEVTIQFNIFKSATKRKSLALLDSQIRAMRANRNLPVGTLFDANNGSIHAIFRKGAEAFPVCLVSAARVLGVVPSFTPRNIASFFDYQTTC